MSLDLALGALVIAIAVISWLDFDSTKLTLFEVGTFVVTIAGVSFAFAGRQGLGGGLLVLALMASLVDLLWARRGRSEAESDTKEAGKHRDEA